MKIEVENLTKDYGEKRVLDIDELTINKGEISGIIGPNGCGKSTLLTIISGLDKDYGGRVRYNDKALDKKIVENMTYVFQKPYLFKKSVYENIAYPLRLRDLSKEEEKERVENIIKRLEIEDLTEKRADRLSGGESQKVALARGLVFEPDLLLLDEPTSNIDPESIKVMEREIVRFFEETGATIAIVTHNLDQAERLSNRIIGLDAGKVVKR